MEYRKIGHSELEVSKICLGTMNWGQQNTKEDAHAQLDFAAEHGVNFIDTAEVYPIPPDKDKQGRTETYLGSWLRKSGKRDNLIIASKVGGPQQKNSIQTRDGSGHLDRDNIRAALEGSLDRLGIEHIDLYQVHRPEREVNNFGVRGYTSDWGGGEVPIEETLEALSELVQEGKIRYIGVSNETPWGVAQYLRVAEERQLARIISIQNQYSLLNRTYEIGLSEFAFREGVELLAYSPLSMGVLTGKYLGGAQPEGARFTVFERNRDRYNGAHLQKAIERYVAIAQDNGLTPTELALAFVNSRPFVATNIIGATSVEQLKEDIGSAEVVLSSDVLEQIEALYKEIPDPQA